TTPYAGLSIFVSTTTGLTSPTTLFNIAYSSKEARTTTLFSVNNIGRTTLRQLTSQLLKTDANGTIIGAIAGVDYATPSSASDVTGTTNFGVAAAATTTPLWLKAGLFASSTAYLTTLNVASTTILAQYGGSVGIGTTSPYAGLSIFVSTTTGIASPTTLF